MDTKVVALGEIGLDDGWCNGKDSEFGMMQRVFFLQLKLAVELKKPIVLHLRGSNSFRCAEYIMNLAKVPKDHPIHMHAFTSTYDVCKSWIGNEWTGMKFGFVSDKFSPTVIKTLPLDR